MGKIVRESFLGKIRLRVKPKKGSFDVEIFIPKDTYLQRESKNGAWHIWFQFVDGGRLTDQTIRIKFQNMRYPKNDLNEPFVKVFVLDGKIEGRIRIEPAFYLSESLRAKRWEMSKAKKDNVKRPSYTGICTRVSRGGGSGIRYTYNNLNRPYQGGGCSPK